ncbi:DUF445 domain-containing protein [Paraferrimonas sp. SM1919]|uniref:DUF445 domain-containing protein n=1 Tax=Paraferrimonas sp. SM1919 TaxID=2662263 RepID=UPI0013D30B2D|nr:DUF445 domain-containing protein [Paraferrimonas sp. SM1919]
MNKNLITNLIAAALVVAGYLSQQNTLFSIGLFALSGAITNSLAIHMLFEKVPGLYGSGVIANRFEAFKAAIASMMMNQFFTPENINKVMGEQSHQLDLEPIIQDLDLSIAFRALVRTVEESSFGSMLAMFGGTEALAPMQQPFENKMKASIIQITQGEEFHQKLADSLSGGDNSALLNKIESIINARLDELTPQLVKEIVQDMIRQHLGWLVVWGGVFGGLIGFLATLV